MSLEQPASSDPQDTPDHSLMHRIIATDAGAAIKSITVESDSSKRLGDGTTNYTEIKADGELTLVGTARVKRQIPIDNANLGKGGTVPSQVILGNYNGWEFDIGDDSVFTIHLPHDWAPGTDVVIQIDWYVDEAYVTNNGEINWQAAYSATPHDTSEAVDAPTHSGTLPTGDIDIPATAKFLTQNSVAIPNADISAEDQIGITLSRIAIVGGNNPSAGKPTVVDIHIEYTSNKLGEAT